MPPPLVGILLFLFESALVGASQMYYFAAKSTIHNQMNQGKHMSFRALTQRKDSNSHQSRWGCTLLRHLKKHKKELKLDCTQ